MTDPLGQSQVIAYLKRLSKEGFSFDIISFEKTDIFHDKKHIVENLIAGYDIRWNYLFYTKSPPVFSTIKDLRNGWNKIKNLFKENHYDIVHCRGYIPSILGEKCQKAFGSKFIFDMRGWWADEKLESGLWNSWVYKPIYYYFKYLEKKFFKNSDVTISLTFAGRDEIVKRGLKNENNIKIIPTCVDFDIFKSFDTNTRNKIRLELNIPEKSTVMLYSGSLGGNYGTDTILNLFQTLTVLREDALLLLLTPTNKDYIQKQIKKAGLKEGQVRIIQSDYINVYKYLMAGDIGVIFYKKTFSVIGRSPTKLGEYWACGLPMISLKEIGDLDYLYEKYPDGCILMDSDTISEYKKSILKFLDWSVDKHLLRNYASDYYNIEKGVEMYKIIYLDVIK